MRRFKASRLPENITEAQLIDLFSEVGPVQHVTIIVNNAVGHSSRTAIIKMSNNVKAEVALTKLNGRVIGKSKTGRCQPFETSWSRI